MAFLGKNLQMETIPEPPKGPLRRPELLALAVGQVIGAGVVTLVGPAIAYTGYSAWLAYFAAIVLGLVYILPIVFITGTVRLGGGQYSMVSGILGPIPAGFQAISCLTEPKWFLGSDQIFRKIRQAVATPMLRKDFTVDPYQLYQARLMGADCVLLLCALLDTRTLADYLALCDDLGLAALVEAHDEKEVASAVAAGARIIGGNNRNLRDFSVNLDNAARLRDRVPPGVLYVAESGVRRPADVAAVRAMGADGVLIGEALMRAKDKSAMLNQFRRSV